MRTTSDKPSDKRGFTLVEIMVAATVCGLVIASVLSVLLQSLKVYGYEGGNLNVNGDIRTFTNDLTEDVLPANYFRVFSTYSNTNFSDAVPAGESGDCLLLVYKDATDDSKFSKLIFYFRAPAANNQGPVYRYVVNFSPSADGPVTELIPSLNRALSTYPQIIPSVSGLASGSKLFTDFNDRSVVVNGAVIRNANGQFHTATQLFSFSATPGS